MDSCKKIMVHAIVLFITIAINANDPKAPREPVTQTTLYIDRFIYPENGIWSGVLAQETAQAIADERAKILTKLKVTIAEYKNQNKHQQFLKNLEDRFSDHLDDWCISIEELK